MSPMQPDTERDRSVPDATLVCVGLGTPQDARAQVT
jgi:hypothetical protein